MVMAMGMVNWDGDGGSRVGGGNVDGDGREGDRDGDGRAFDGCT